MPKEFEPQSLSYLQESIPIFDALKDEHRQNLLVTLVCRGRLNMTELAESSTLSRTAVSHHVKILERVGLITVTKQGTTRFCEPNLEQVLELLRSLVAALDADVAASRQHREASPQ